MARGWESKSVEEQMAQQAQQPVNAADRKAAQHAAEADRKRQRQALELQRERILSERTSSAHRREALSQALAAIEEKLAELGWSIHV
jgi:anion-transporting  ArsA/GET3 family ATPase